MNDQCPADFPRVIAIRLFIPFPILTFPPGNWIAARLLAKALDQGLEIAEFRHSTIICCGEINDCIALVGVDDFEGALKCIAQILSTVSLNELAEIGYFCHAELIWRPVDPAKGTQFPMMNFDSITTRAELAAKAMASRPTS